jgi:hypothetical protein
MLGTPLVGQGAGRTGGAQVRILAIRPFPSWVLKSRYRLLAMRVSCTSRLTFVATAEERAPM